MGVLTDIRCSFPLCRNWSERRFNAISHCFLPAISQPFSQPRFFISRSPTRNSLLSSQAAFDPGVRSPHGPYESSLVKEPQTPFPSLFIFYLHGALSIVSKICGLKSCGKAGEGICSATLSLCMRPWTVNFLPSGQCKVQMKHGKPS